LLHVTKLTIFQQSAKKTMNIFRFIRHFCAEIFTFTVVLAHWLYKNDLCGRTMGL